MHYIVYSFNICLVSSHIKWTLVYIHKSNIPMNLYCRCTGGFYNSKDRRMQWTSKMNLSWGENEDLICFAFVHTLSSEGDRREVNQYNWWYWYRLTSSTGRIHYCADAFWSEFFIEQKTMITLGVGSDKK